MRNESTTFSEKDELYEDLQFSKDSAELLKRVSQTWEKFKTMQKSDDAPRIVVKATMIWQP